MSEANGDNLDCLVGRDLIRWDDCPLGKDLQPGCGICQKCEHFGVKEWACNGGTGCYITRCNAPNARLETERRSEADER